MSKLPVMIDITEKLIVVIGGGKAVERRLNKLSKWTENIVIISPSITAQIKELVASTNIVWKKREFHPLDIENASLVIIATNDVELNRRISHDAPSHAWINAMHDAENGDLEFPIYMQNGHLTIAISTNGASPILAKKIKKDMEEKFNDKYVTYIDFLYEVRQLLKGLSIDPLKKHDYLKQIVENPIYEEEDQLAYLKELKSENK